MKDFIGDDEDKFEGGGDDNDIERSFSNGSRMNFMYFVLFSKKQILNK
jgi:hypothetical protein